MSTAEHAKPATSRKPGGATRKPSGHPPFAEMISDAIVVLKERNGSSQVAIQKFIEEKYKHLPMTFRKLLLVQLKRMVASGKLVRVKHSFKLAPSSKPATTKPKPKPKAKESAAFAKPKSKRGVVTSEKESDSAGTKKVAEKPSVKAKPADASMVARTSKQMTSPGMNTEAKPKKTAKLKKVKSPMKKSKPKRAKSVKAAEKK